MIRRLFVAHPRNVLDGDLAELVEGITRAFAGRTLASGEPIELEITTGRASAKAWEEAHRGLAFNWKAWQRSILGTVGGAFSTEPAFHYFVVGPSLVIGRATAEILEKTLASRRTVMYLDDGTLRKVARVAKIREDDWKTGWAAILT